MSRKKAFTRQVTVDTPDWMRDFRARWQLNGKRMVLAPRGPWAVLAPFISHWLGRVVFTPAAPTAADPHPVGGLRFALGPKVPPLAGLEMTNGGRMANRMMQFINAVYLAERLGLPVILSHEKKLVPLAATAARSVAILPAKSKGQKGFFLKSRFFFDEDFGPHHPRLLDGLTAADRHRITRDYVAPAMGFGPLDPARQQAQARDLAVHIRSGDIFPQDGRKPNAWYIQPPLAFYKKVITERLAEGLIDRVVIVCEDRRNPCIDALEVWLGENNIPMALQNGTLDEDLAYLRHARHFVFGTGTFGYGVAMLAGQIDTLAVFSHEAENYAGMLTIARLEHYTAAPERYIEPGRWQASAAQKQLMLDFPAEDLRLRV